MVAMGKRMELLVGLVLYILVADQSGQARGAVKLESGQMGSLLGPRGEVPEEGGQGQCGDVGPGLVAAAGVEEAGRTEASRTCQT